MAIPVRVGVAFDDVSLEPSPTWTYLTDTPNLVAGYEIDRGRQYEFDRTDTGTCTVTINDVDGLLDPTNSAGPYFGKIDPLRQIIVDLWNPVTEDYHTRFRGFIDELDYVVDPSQQVTQLKISCVDLFAILTAIEMQPGVFGDTPPPESVGSIFFDNASAHDRAVQVLVDGGIPDAYYVVFSLNVNMQESSYSPSENVLQVIEDVADADFPTVANAYCDRLGRLALHGRVAKFDPVTVAAGAGSTAWDFHAWSVGDQAAVGDGTGATAHLRAFSFNRGLDKVYNSALSTPNGIAPEDIANQLVQDAVSIGIYGIRSWSAENLFIGATAGDPLKAAGAGILTGNDALTETQLFATYITANYASPRNRVTELTLRTMDPATTGASATWEMLSKADISDTAAVTVGFPGGGDFNAEPYFIEGLHETALPANGRYADVTLSLDLSPQAYFSNPEGLDGV